MATIFDSQYAHLNPTQRAAVDAIEGPVMVIAGPGTGKTTILTLRIANILRLTDTPAHGILAITYTSAGVKAIQKKLLDIIGNRAHEVAIHTFHSFALAMIGEYHDHFHQLDGLRNMTSVEQESLIRSIISESSTGGDSAAKFADLRPIGAPDIYISSILSAIDTSKREDLSPEKVREHARKEIERIKNDETSISTRGATKGQLKADAKEQILKCEKTLLFADVYEEYEKRKRAEKYMDFNDNISELLNALRTDELFLRLIQERFLYIMVDEHQDTNDSQNQIVKLIAEFFDTPNVFIVGDEKQAIYRFQGASVENFLGLQSNWHEMKEIALDTNYRSHQAILDASFAMIENNYADGEHANLRVRLTAGGSELGRPVDIVTGENALAAETYFVNELKAITQKEPKATVAIIARRNRDLERVIRLLESNGIPVSSERSVDIFHHPIGAVFFDLIEYLADPSKSDALAKTLAAGMWGLAFEQSVQLIRDLRSGKLANVEKLLPNLLHLQRKMLGDGAVGYLVHAAEQSGFTSLVVRDPAYIHVWRGIIALAESLARERTIQHPGELIKAMLDYRQSAETKTVKVSVGAPDLPIQAMTAHASKGLEFDYVFMPYATQEAWIGRSRGASFVLPEKKASTHDTQDIRRLFYVALTRARKHAVIITALEESDGKEMMPLQFISELDPKSVKQIVLPRMEAELQAELHKEPLKDGGQPGSADTDLKSAGRSAENMKLIGLVKEVLTDSGLSVTALNHFIKCPNEFLYQSILKLPQAPAPAAEKGNAMHDAISQVWNEKALNTESAELLTEARITEIIVTAITEHLDASFLPANEKEAVKKELIENAPAVSKALLPHFAAEGPISAERWVKTVFNGVYKHAVSEAVSEDAQAEAESRQITIPIHGKLDAIVEAGEEVFVFDYKTRQSMSVAAIKGETKSSSGDYFRQLVFYKILMSDEMRWKTRKITPALVFVSPDDKGRCPTVSLPIAAEDIAAVKAQIQSVIDSVWSGAIATARCDERDCEWCGLREISQA